MSESARQGAEGRVRGWLRSALRLTSLRLRLVTVFALMSLTAAFSVAGIAYWLNRDAVLTRAQDAVLEDFRKSLDDQADELPEHPGCTDLVRAAAAMGSMTERYEVILIDERVTASDCLAASDPSVFDLRMVPQSLTDAVNERRDLADGVSTAAGGGQDGGDGSGNGDAGESAPAETERAMYHLYWQRIMVDGDPHLIGGARVIDAGTTGYLLASLVPERDDLNSLAWSLGIFTGLAVIGSVLMAQAAATMVLRPVQRLSDAAQRLGAGELDTRLAVRGADELAELTRTFNVAAASLEQRVADLSAREESSRRFVADMSHELRTPMTAITAVTEVLEDEVDNLDPMIAPAVQLVVSETRRLNDLVENLMEVTRFDAGTAKIVLDDVDIADQVTACIDARAWLDAVSLDADRGIMARVDPRRLDVILANLIGNALKHGGPPVRVSVREDTGPERHDVVVEVTDRGPGIPRDVLPHVFDRFYKASASRPRSEGSGLGLSIAQENAHVHGGEITAANAPDGGAVFTLRLPREALLPRQQDGDTGDAGEESSDGAAGASHAGEHAGGRAGEEEPR